MEWKSLGILALLVFVSACAEGELEPEQQYYRDETTGPQAPSAPYLDAKGKTLTQQIQKVLQPRKKVFVLDFWNDTPIQDYTYGMVASEQLKKELFSSKRVMVPLDIAAELRTEDLVEGSKVKVGQLVRYGRKLGLSALVIGRISNIAFRQEADEIGLLREVSSVASVDLEIKVFDVNTGREVVTAGQTGVEKSSAMAVMDKESVQGREFRKELISEAIRKVMHRLVPPIGLAVEKMSWEGRVAKVQGEMIYVNSGRQSGLMVGDILKVLTPGEEVYDPSTGAYLGRTEGRLKGTLEVKSFMGADSSVTQLHTGGNFRDGDVVRLY